MSSISEKQLEELLETLIALKWMLFGAGNHTHNKTMDESIKIVEQLQSQLMDSYEKTIF
jgi:hypothetical protein